MLESPKNLTKDSFYVVIYYNIKTTFTLLLHGFQISIKYKLIDVVRVTQYICSFTRQDL